MVVVGGGWKWLMEGHFWEVLRIDRKTKMWEGSWLMDREKDSDMEMQVWLWVVITVITTVKKRWHEYRPASLLQRTDFSLAGWSSAPSFILPPPPPQPHSVTHPHKQNRRKCDFYIKESIDSEVHCRRFYWLIDYILMFWSASSKQTPSLSKTDSSSNESFLKHILYSGIYLFYFAKSSNCGHRNK